MFRQKEKHIGNFLHLVHLSLFWLYLFVGSERIFVFNVGWEFLALTVGVVINASILYTPQAGMLW